ncbi:MAG: PQQ-binding-like beta-propeller repeat protein [Chthoniobacterales bacterium]
MKLPSLLTLSLLLGATLAAEAQTQTVVWQQSINFSSFSDWGPSQRSSSGSVNAEIADDFDVVGTITRIDVNGFGVSTQAAAFQGVYVHFYAYGSDNLPGALQAEYFIPAGDPRILNPDDSSDFRIALGSSFQCTGRHFVSVQVLSDDAWYWRSADDNAPRNTALFYRNPSAGQANWTHTIQYLGTANSDTAFTLYGTRTLTTPALSTLSTNTLPQAGRLKLTGSGFGAQQGTGVVKIGGAVAPVSNWSDTAITAYVSDLSPIATDNVQVVTSGGTSNPLPLQVTARPATVGQVKWRFQADDLYIIGRPAVGADGTIYAAGVKGHLYALTPAGGVKWIYSIGPANVQQPVSVGPDGTIYFSSVATIYAVNPDGTLKWTFSDPGSAIIFAGPTAGPDGNVYAASSDRGLANGLGAFALSPAGVKLSNLPGFSTRYGYSNIEVVFGSGHWYFTNNAAGAVGSAGSLWAFNLGGTNLVWNRPAEKQPRVQPSGNIVVGDRNPTHPGLQDFNPGGSLLWVALGEGRGIDAQTAVDVSSGDGSVYLGTLTFGVGRHLTSLDANGAIRWQFRDEGIASNPAVSPLNTLVLYSAYDIGAPSHVNALSTAGQLLWTENLPAENGGFVRALSTPRFSADGAAAYVGMDVNDGASDPYSYLYAFVTGAPAPVPTSVVSRKNHGAAGAFDIALPLTGTPGIECRTGGSGGDHQIVLTFANPVTVGAVSVGSSDGFATATSSVSGPTVTVTLHNVTDAQTVSLTLSNVNDGNGTGAVSLPIAFLAGDTNGDRVVNGGDAVQTRSRSGETTNQINFRSDVNLDGSVNGGDSLFLRTRSGNAL